MKQLVIVVVVFFFFFLGGGVKKLFLMLLKNHTGLGLGDGECFANFALIV